ncbi:MAG TPA: flagellar basal body protein, partial [Bacillota bacterium]
MLRGLYVATAGMLSESARHAIHSTNIANINTPGYRARRPVVGDFQRLWVQQLAGGAHHVLGTAGTGPALV